MAVVNIQIMLPGGIYDTIQIGSLTLQTWGIMVAAGFIVGALIARREAARRGVDPDDLLTGAIFLFIGSLLGARIFFVFLFWHDFLIDPVSVFKIWEGGMVFYGGFVGALLAGLLYLRFFNKNRLRVGLMCDIIAPGLALGLAIGRIGCHLIKDHIGRITTLPFAVNFFGQPRHETAMYSALAALAIFIVLWSVRKKEHWSGFLMILFLWLYSVERFFIDFLRAHDLPLSDPRFWGLTVSQYICLVIFAATSVIFIVARRKKDSQKQTSSPGE